MLEKDVVGSACVHVRLNVSLLHSSKRYCKVFTSGVTRHEAAEAVASVNKMGVALQKFC